jgi:F-type H+-transporting ATPase subunit epsilon
MNLKQLNVEIVTPHGPLFAGKATAVQLQTRLGQVEIGPDHESIIMALDIGHGAVFTHDGVERFAMNVGYVEVLDNHVEIMMETAEMVSDVDTERSEESVRIAKERLEKLDFAEDRARVDRAKDKLRRAEARLALVSKFGSD